MHIKAILQISTEIWVLCITKWKFHDWKLQIVKTKNTSNEFNSRSDPAEEKSIELRDSSEDESQMKHWEFNIVKYIGYNNRHKFRVKNV